MKNLLLAMLLLSSISYAKDIKFSPELDKTKWEYVDENTKVIFEFDSPYLIVKTYQNSTLEDVSTTRILHYDKLDDLHFLFHDENSLPITFHRVKKKMLHRVIIDNTSATNIILKPNKK